jgi:hypothetical protein
LVENIRKKQIEISGWISNSMNKKKIEFHYQGWHEVAEVDSGVDVHPCNFPLGQRPVPFPGKLQGVEKRCFSLSKEKTPRRGVIQLSRLIKSFPVGGKKKKKTKRLENISIE